jgi:hypothetical protein
LSFSRLAFVIATFGDMTLSSNSPLPVSDERPTYRLVVKARTSGHKGYVWEIVREDDHTHQPVSRSAGTYATMEEAYTKGSVALARIRAFGAPARSG